MNLNKTPSEAIPISLLVTLLEHKEHVHLSFVPKSARTHQIPHFYLFLTCNDNFLQKGTETCQYFSGRWLVGCEHLFLLIISANKCYLSHWAAPSWYYSRLLPLQVMRWLQNVAEECNWILSRTGLVLKLMNNVSAEQSIGSTNTLRSFSCPADYSLTSPSPFLWGADF